MTRARTSSPWVVMASLALVLGCRPTEPVSKPVAAPAGTVTPTPPAAPVRDPAAALREAAHGAAPTPPPEAPVPPPVPGKLRFIDAPAGGDAREFIAKQVAASAAVHRVAVVYVGATWCEPCERFHQAAKAGQLDAEFGDVDVVAFDLNRDGDRLSPLGYDSQYIPLLCMPAADGRATSRRSEGAVKGDGAVPFMTPRLKQLLGRAG